MKNQKHFIKLVTTGPEGAAKAFQKLSEKARYDRLVKTSMRWLLPPTVSTCTQQPVATVTTVATATHSL